ncbi:hypothetical protein EHV15_02070 [Paenibacillus oralis]|uniref:Uncharacterized protein n=1 Tax=Paenibacillus oralis TaxID=2490856 RepID=A0A3P3TVW5_9BACL|nr:hypothetical protein [Paenibacillus oralis]RRJ61894.1 hypothetical protein EHV15_02070 [Paenibacillus oralis]
MNKAQDFDTFLQQTVLKKADEHYKRAMEHLIQNKQQVIDEYVAAFQDLCLDIKQKQRLNPAIKVSYIQYSLLFSHVLLKKAPYRLEAFDGDYYLGNVISEANYNPTWLFEPLHAFYEEIQREAKKYILRVNPIEVERIFLIELKKYEEIVKFLAKEAIETLVDTEEYQSLPYGEEVQFRIGEFRGTTDILFIKNARNDELWRYVCGLFSNQAR